MELSEIDIRKLVVPKEGAETEGTLPCSSEIPITAPVVGILYPTFKVRPLYDGGENQNKVFHQFSIMSCHSSSKCGIMMILSKNEVDVVTKKVQVSTLHTVLILYF